MQTMNFGKLLEMILILVLGGQQPKPAAPGPDMRLHVKHDVPLYVEIDPGALVAAGTTVPELKKAMAVAASRDGAAAYVAETIGAKPAAVKEAFTGVRRVGFWLLGWGEDDDNFRALLVIERSDMKTVIPPLVTGNTKIVRPAPNDPRRRQEGHMELSYNDIPIHGFGGRRGSAIWVTEHLGKVAIATDPLALHSFILNAKPAPGAATRKLQPRKPGAIVWAEVNAPTALNQFLMSLGRHDMREMLSITTFFDFPSWEQASLALTKDRLTVRIGIDPAGKLNSVLAPPSRRPALLAALPDDCDLALIVSLKDPNALWTHIRSGYAELMKVAGRPERKDDLQREFQEELGLDIQKDIVDNIVAGGVAVPVLKRERDIERNFAFLAQAKDSARAEVSLRKFVARAMRGSATPMTVGNAKVWANDEGKAALVGKLAVLGPTEGGSGVDRILKAVTAKSSEMGAILPKRFPGATSFGMFNPSFLLKGKDVGRLAGGLSFQSNTLKLEVDYNLAKIAAAFTETVEAAILRGKKTQAVNNLRLVAKAAQGYLSDYAKYPDTFAHMLKYAANDKSLFVSPVTGKPYVFNKKIAGMQVGTVPSRRTTVLAYEEPTAVSLYGGGHVVYLDGNVQWLDTARFKATVRPK